MTQKWILAGTLAFATVPVAVLLQGCSGGAGVGTNVNPGATTVLNNAALTLDNGQTGALTLIVNNANVVSGNLVVNPTALPLTAAGKRSTQVLPLLAPGTYPVTGTFTAPDQYTVTATLPIVGTVTLTGHVPASSAAGDYTLTAGGQTFSGSFTTPTPTATATATATGTNTPTPTATQPQPGANKLTGLVLNSTANFNNAPIDAPNFSSVVIASINNQLFLQQAGVESGIGNRGATLTAAFPTGGGYNVGTTYTFGQQIGTANGIQFTLSQNTTASTARLWRANGGTLHLTAYSAGKFTGTINNAVMVADNVASTDKTATGQFTFTGTVNFAGIQVTPTPTSPPGQNQAVLTLAPNTSNIGFNAITMSAGPAGTNPNGFDANFYANGFIIHLEINASSKFANMAVGSKVVLNGTGTDPLILLSDQSGNSVGTNHTFQAVAGTLTVTSFTSETAPITVTLKDVVMKPLTVLETGATGQFTMNGTANFKSTF